MKKKTLMLPVLYTGLSTLSTTAFSDVDRTQSLGRFSVRLTPEAGKALGLDNCPGNLNDPRDPCRINSPGLEDNETLILRSIPHFDGDETDRNGAEMSCGTLTYQSGCAEPLPTVKDSDFAVIPEGPFFFPSPEDTEEVHTQVLALHLRPNPQNCCCDQYDMDRDGQTNEAERMRCSMNWNLPSANAVRAGIHAPDQPRSLGEVETKVTPGSSGNFSGYWFSQQAESFFNMFVEVDVDANFDNVPEMTLYNKEPLVVQNGSVYYFPPPVVYIHTDSDAPLVYDKKTGQAIGWLTLAGHGSGYMCRSCYKLLSPAQDGPAAADSVADSALSTNPCPSQLGHVEFDLGGGSCTGAPDFGWPLSYSGGFENIPEVTRLQPFTLTIRIAGTGRGEIISRDGKIHCGPDCEGQYPYDDNLASLEVSAFPGSSFIGWQGEGCGGTVVMTNDKECTALFSGKTTLSRDMLVSVKLAGTGTGQIVSEPEGILCGTLPPVSETDPCQGQPSDFLLHCLSSTSTVVNQQAQCSHRFPTATDVKLTVIPDGDSTFIGFGGHQDCADDTLFLTGNRYCTAYLAKLYPLTVTVMGQGKVISYDEVFKPNGINCSAQNVDECTLPVPDNETVVLKALPATSFQGWSGDCQGHKNPMSVKLKTAKKCTARFK